MFGHTPECSRPWSQQKGVVMNNSEQPNDKSEEPIPAMQRVLDNPFLLLFLGVTIPTVLYLIWGIMEVASVPIGS